MNIMWPGFVVRQAQQINPAAYWFVAFPAQTEGSQPWYLRMLSPRWRHCLVLQHEPQREINQILIAEHIGSQTRIELQARSIGSAILELQQKHAAVVLLVEQRSPEPRAMMRGPMTCVEFVKGVLGIRRPWIVTPHQLYRYLRRTGASHVFPTAAMHNSGD